jgi:hypothetical protein
MNQLGILVKVKRIGIPRIQGPDVISDVEEAEEEEAENWRGELETLLRSFEDDEIQPEEQSTEVSLAKRLLLLPAQNRSFRICRRELFCSDEGCHQARRYKSIGQLTNPCKPSMEQQKKKQQTCSETSSQGCYHRKSR